MASTRREPGGGPPRILTCHGRASRNADGAAPPGEALAALSLVTDLARGHPPEEAVRACLVATRLAELMDVPPPDRADVYYATLLRFVGCTATSHEYAVGRGWNAWSTAWSGRRPEAVPEDRPFDRWRAAPRRAILRPSDGRRRTGMDTELWEMGAVELGASIAGRDVTAREVVTSHLERIAKVNGQLNAVTAVLEAEALAAADEADERARRGDPTGPLHGVPFTVKGNIDVAGTASTWGLAALAEAVVPGDAPMVERLRAAGAIPIGRTNLPDLALRWHTDSGAHGATVNPWDRSRTPGGSSGGEAVALATGMTPLGLGNDLGGSLRVPAQACGVASLKPTTGRVPTASALDAFRDGTPAGQLMWAFGPMARHVRDVRAAYEAIAGPDPRDPLSVPVPLAAEPLPGPIRVAVVADPAGVGVHPAVADGIRLAADALANAGYAVEEVEPPRLGDARDLWIGLLLADLHVLSPMVGPLASEAAQKFLADAFQSSPPLDLAGVVTGYMSRHALAREWSEFQAERPLVLGPVSTQPPFEVGYDLQGPDAVTDLVTRLTLTVAVNLLGLPASAVPTGVAEGLPQGVQVIGPRFREDLCLDAAEAIEERLGTITPIDPR